MVKPFIAGNWKMFKNKGEALAFAEELKQKYISSDVRVAIFAPYLNLETLKEAFKDTDIKVGAQNMHFEKEGAFTGEISGEMLQSIGVEYVVIGHSERREYFGETDSTVNLKLKKAFELKMRPIMCIGENLEEREAGKEFEKVKRQLMEGLKEIPKENIEKLVIAYEPIWAIGTGKTATKEQANEMCSYIRDVLTELFDEAVACKVTIQYGGSVKPENISDLMNMPEIDGALVGGASLKANSFLDIINF